MANTVNTINNSLYQKLNYNFIADFAPVANVMGTPLLVLVHPSVAVRNAAELIALAKASPGKLNLASGGVGSTGHMSAELFQMMAGIKLTHVPYRGEAPALTDLIAGQAQLMVSTTGSSLQYARAGTVRALATTTDDRVAELPDVPPLSKTVPGYSGQRLERPLCAERNAAGDHHLAQQGGEPRDGRSEDQGAHRQPWRCRAARLAGGLRPNDRGRHRQVGQGRAVLRRARELNSQRPGTSFVPSSCEVRAAIAAFCWMRNAPRVLWGRQCDCRSVRERKRVFCTVSNPALQRSQASRDRQGAVIKLKREDEVAKTVKDAGMKPQ